MDYLLRLIIFKSFLFSFRGFQTFNFSSPPQLLLLPPFFPSFFHFNFIPGKILITGNFCVLLSRVLVKKKTQVSLANTAFLFAKDNNTVVPATEKGRKERETIAKKIVILLISMITLSFQFIMNTFNLSMLLPLSRLDSILFSK